MCMLVSITCDSRATHSYYHAAPHFLQINRGEMIETGTARISLHPTHQFSCKSSEVQEIKPEQMGIALLLFSFLLSSKQTFPALFSKWSHKLTEKSWDSTLPPRPSAGPIHSSPFASSLFPFDVNWPADHQLLGSLSLSSLSSSFFASCDSLPIVTFSGYWIECTVSNGTRSRPRGWLLFPFMGGLP